MIPFSVCGEKSGLGIYFFDQHGQRSSDDESGILATDGDKQIIWYSKGAVKVLRNISCPNKPIDALICNFAGAPGSINARTSAIAILLTSELLQLHLFNGETFDIHLPVPMTKIFSSSQGLLLQRTTTSYEQFRPVASDSSNINSLFSSRGSHLDREDSFDVKLWLDEANDANEKKMKVNNQIITYRNIIAITNDFDILISFTYMSPALNSQYRFKFSFHPHELPLTSLNSSLLYQ